MITPGYPPTVGGTEIQCARLSEALVARGVEVRVVTRGRDHLSRQETMGGVLVRRARGRAERRTWPRRAVDAVGFLAHVVAEVRRFRGTPGSIIHHHGLSMTLVAARLAAGAHPPPIVAKVMGGGAAGECARVASQRRFWPVRWVLAHVDRFVALQPSLRDELVALGVASQKVEILPNGVPLPSDPAVTPGREKLARQKMVLFGGRLDALKNLDSLLEAWVQVVKLHPDARLTLAGDGPERSRLQERSRGLGIATSVDLPGFRADYPRLVAECAVFVLPSRSEGMSNALLEAMAAGRACLVSDIDENRFTLGDAGWYFPMGDAGALADRLHELLASDEESRRLGAAARRRIEESFTLEVVVERYLELYRALLA
jgi:glycosyltransferase involved in cell wall biosynthesis